MKAKKYNFHYSTGKKSFVVCHTSICVQDCGDGEWRAYRAYGSGDYLSFGSLEGYGKNPHSAVNALLKLEKEWKNEEE